MWDLGSSNLGEMGRAYLKKASNALLLQRDDIKVDSISRIGNLDGMGQGSGITREELWDLVNLHPIAIQHCMGHSRQ